MLDVTKQIKKELGGLGTFIEKNEWIRNKYAGKDCVILSCGPSFASVDLERLKKKLEGKLVIAIKQTFDELPEFVDVHIYNCANFKACDYSRNPDAIIVECATFPYLLNQQCDIRYIIRERSFSNSVAIRNDIAKWELDRKYERPYGPGIMCEIVFYLAKHLGVKNITTIGWDNRLPVTADDLSHFYDKKDGVHIHDNDVSSKVPFENLKYEAKITTDAAINWYHWLKNSKIDLQIISHLSTISSDIPRIELESL